MMKRILVLVMVLFISRPLFMPALAYGEYEPFMDFAMYIEDYNQTEYINDLLSTVSEKYGVELIIYTEEEMCGDSPEEASAVVHDYFDCGSKTEGNVIMMYVAKDIRKYNFRITGEHAQNAINSSGLTYLENKVVPYLSEDDYYRAFVTFAESSEYLLELGAQGEPYNKKETGYVITIIAIAIILPIIVAFIAMSVQLQKMNTAEKENYASNYVKPGSMNLDCSNDIFMYSRIVKRVKPKNTSSSSGQGSRNRSGSF